MDIRKTLDSSDQMASDNTVTARLHRISWRRALGNIVSPAFRLHRYRSAHNRILQDAFCELDSRDSGGCNA
jgi:hypothetical protein